MSAPLPTFDESWHQVTPRRVRLRPGVEIHAQSFRGQRWYVLRDHLSGKFFRVRPAAYTFITELERSDTVGEAWERCIGDRLNRGTEAARVAVYSSIAKVLKYESRITV